MPRHVTLCYGSILWLYFPSYLLWVWTEFFCRIHHDGRKQAETFRLSIIFLKFLWRDLPPSAKQVQALSATSGDVKVRHETVCARWLQDAEGVVEVVKTDAVAVQRDVGADFLTGLPEAEMTVDGQSSGVVCKDDVGCVSLFEPLLVWLTAQAACDQHPFAQQIMDIHPIQRLQQVVAGHCGWPAHREGAKKKSGTQEKHVSVLSNCRSHSSVGNCCFAIKNCPSFILDLAFQNPATNKTKFSDLSRKFCNCDMCKDFCLSTELNINGVCLFVNWHLIKMSCAVTK